MLTEQINIAPRRFASNSIISIGKGYKGKPSYTASRIIHPFVRFAWRGNTT